MKTAKSMLSACVWPIIVSVVAAVLLLVGQFPIGAETAAAPRGQEGKARIFTGAPADKPQGPPGGETSKPSVEKWIVIPVTTELQRITAGPDARVYVLVDGEAFKQNQVMLDARALNLDGLRRELRPYSEPEKGTVHFHIRYISGPVRVVIDEKTRIAELREPGAPQKRDYVTPVLLYALRGFGQAAGFRGATTESIGYRVLEGEFPSWEAMVADLRKNLAEDVGREESGIGNEKFKVYPVRTTLSRFMYNDADCVLHVLVERGIGPNEIKAIEECVAKLNLKSRRSILITGSEQTVLFLGRRAFYEERLGFEEVTMRPR